MKFKKGDFVVKIGGDYEFRGTIVSAFRKLSGVERYVVENKAGLLHKLAVQWLCTTCHRRSHYSTVASTERRA